MDKIRDFERPNTHGGFVCPICGTSEEKRVRLIPIKGTEDDGICEGIQIHTDCLPNVNGFVYMRGVGAVLLVKDNSHRGE